MVFGLTFLIIAFFWIFTRINNNETIKLFDWFYTAIFGLNGLVHIIAGLGYSIESIFGKAFIKIDNDNINIKLGIFEKEKKVNWKDILSIDYKPNNFKILKRDNSIQLFSISKLDYSCISEIKEIISRLAEDKKIDCSII
jgi:hypothetical protein